MLILSKWYIGFTYTIKKLYDLNDIGRARLFYEYAVACICQKQIGVGLYLPEVVWASELLIYRQPLESQSVPVEGLNFHSYLLCYYIA